MGETRHEQRDFAPLLYEMLIHGGKFYHFIKVGIELVDRDEQPRSCFGEFVEHVTHAVAPC